MLCDQCFGDGVEVIYREKTNTCCENCAQLSRDEREAVQALRAQLDQY